MEIVKPKKYRRKVDSPFAVYDYGNGNAERVYPSGAISFPEYDTTSQTYTGCLTICAGNVESSVFKLYDVIYFNFYTPVFWNKLRQIHDDFGIIDYYYDIKREDDANRLRVASDTELEKGNKVTVPHLMRVEFPSDFSAYNLLLQKIAAKQFFYRVESPMHNAIIRWDTEKPYDHAPIEIKAVCINAYGADKDLMYYRQEELRND